MVGKPVQSDHFVSHSIGACAHSMFQIQILGGRAVLETVNRTARCSNGVAASFISCERGRQMFPVGRKVDFKITQLYRSFLGSRVNLGA